MGRPYKCPCGSTATVSKGVRRTKTLGDRRIRRCKACGRKFTPKNQQPIEPKEESVTKQNPELADVGTPPEGSAPHPEP